MKPYTPPKGDIRNIERGKRALADMIADSERKSRNLTVCLCGHTRDIHGDAGERCGSVVCECQRFTEDMRPRR